MLCLCDAPAGRSRWDGQSRRPGSEGPAHRSEAQGNPEFSGWCGQRPSGLNTAGQSGVAAAPPGRSVHPLKRVACLAFAERRTRPWAMGCRAESIGVSRWPDAAALGPRPGSTARGGAGPPDGSATSAGCSRREGCRAGGEQSIKQGRRNRWRAWSATAARRGSGVSRGVVEVVTLNLAVWSKGAPVAPVHGVGTRNPSRNDWKVEATKPRFTPVSPGHGSSSKSQNHTASLSPPHSSGTWL